MKISKKVEWVEWMLITSLGQSAEARARKRDVESSRESVKSIAGKVVPKRVSEIMK